MAGIATVVVGTAWDIVTHCQVPRFVYNDLPLGNPLGNPWDIAMQSQTIDRALSMLVDAKTPTAEAMQHRFSSDDRWKTTYMAVTEENREELRVRGEENRKQMLVDKAAGLKRE
ncbi:MAG: hypothetical protein AAF525_11855 [Pseudomonadota bacterium]